MDSAHNGNEWGGEKRVVGGKGGGERVNKDERGWLTDRDSCILGLSIEHLL